VVRMPARQSYLTTMKRSLFPEIARPSRLVQQWKKTTGRSVGKGRISGMRTSVLSAARDTNVTHSLKLWQFTIFIPHTDFGDHLLSARHGLTHLDKPLGLTHLNIPLSLTHLDKLLGRIHLDIPLSPTHLDIPLGLTHLDIPLSPTHLDIPLGRTHLNIPVSLIHLGIHLERGQHPNQQEDRGQHPNQQEDQGQPPNQ